ncbi:hypothetical protein ILYODFUR_030778 [Ilyodon furcidens]|uniref:Uncharacterized protein n=1 Tax=Ilyodon furcidens TaxID=33524 RepID=A0ABV0TZ41_9TELE
MCSRCVGCGPQDDRGVSLNGSKLQHFLSQLCIASCSGQHTSSTARQHHPKGQLLQHHPQLLWVDHSHKISVKYIEIFDYKITGYYKWKELFFKNILCCFMYFINAFLQFHVA